MASVQINPKVKIGFEELLNGFSKLETKEIELFINEISNLVAKRKAPNLSKREAELLLSINKTWSSKKQEKFNLLFEKLQDETISDKEYEMYMKLVEESEKQSLQRVIHLTELAQIRKITLRELMNQLGINIRPTNYV